MTEAQSAEQFRLLQQEIVLAGEAVETPSATSGPPLMRSALKWKC